VSQASDCDTLIASLLSGGFPEAVARSSAERRTVWFDSYLQAILQREVRDLANVEQMTEIPHLLRLLATRSASLLNLAELSRAIGLPQTTLKRYFSLLEMLFLVVRLPSWERNPGKRLVKAPKVFFARLRLARLPSDLSPERLKGGVGLPGGLLALLCWANSRNIWHFLNAGLACGHYPTQTDIEVEFVLENRLGEITGIEVKASGSVDGKDFKGLRHLKETESHVFQRGIVLYSGREIVPFAPDLIAVLLSAFWGGA
jgi:hypothetical protein